MKKSSLAAALPALVITGLLLSGCGMFRSERAWQNAQQKSPLEIPPGLDTPSAQAPMSGGEIQRIGLARAFAHASQARLLILDDAMSSLDTVTEMRVSQALTSHLGGRTCLVIAHRAASGESPTHSAALSVE